MKTHLRIMGDIHGHVRSNSGDPIQGSKTRSRCYSNLIQPAEYSLQIGDFGFSDSWSWLADTVDASRHKVLGGNHDDYDWIESNNPPQYLSNSGQYSFPGFSFFFIRGGNSIDKRWRIPHRSWWEQEELNGKQCEEAITAYEQAKPDIMVSHDCPWQFYPYVITNYDKMTESPNNTARLLDAIFNIHKPKLWIFGHHHHNYVTEYEGTRFICINELSYLDVDTNGNFLTEEPQ